MNKITRTYSVFIKNRTVIFFVITFIQIAYDKNAHHYHHSFMSLLPNSLIQILLTLHRTSINTKQLMCGCVLLKRLGSHLAPHFLHNCVFLDQHPLPYLNGLSSASKTCQNSSCTAFWRRLWCVFKQHIFWVTKCLLI